MSNQYRDWQSVRGAQRLKIFQPTEIYTGAGATRAHLLDVSTTGALMHCAVPPDAGAIISLAIGGVRRTATVVWREASKFGVAFAIPLLLADVDRALTLHG